MRLVVDTNVLVSALLSGASAAGAPCLARRRFRLLTSAAQLDEVMRVTRYPKIRARLAPALAGRLVNELRAVATVMTNLPVVAICADPNDDYLLATAQAGAADYLVTGDKRDLLGLRRHQGTRIITVRDFLVLNRQLP